MKLIFHLEPRHVFYFVKETYEILKEAVLKKIEELSEKVKGENKNEQKRRCF